MKNKMTDNKKRALLNFKKAKSHVEKIIKMTETNEYCVDIMQQNLAVIGLLKSAHKMLMEGHLKSCFAGAINSGNEKKKKEMTEEILTVTSLFNR